jgi:hypothetical protein
MECSADGSFSRYGASVTGKDRPVQLQRNQTGLIFMEDPMIIRNSIQFKLLVVAAGAIALAVMITGSAAYLVARYAMLDRLETTDIRNIAELKAGQISVRMGRAIETSRLLAEGPAGIEWFRSGENDPVSGRIFKNMLTDMEKISATLPVLQ